MCQTDEQCISLCLDGQPHAYRWLVQRHQEAVLAHLHRRQVRPDLADEATHEAFVQAYFALGRLRKPASFGPWVMRIAERMLQRLARDQRRTAASGDLVDVAAPPAGAGGDEELSAAVARLPAIYREVIVLRFHGGLSCVQVAQRLGVPVPTVTTRLSRAYRMLRETLGGRPEPTRGGA